MKNDFLDNIIKEKLNQQQYEFTEADWSSFESKQSQSGNPGTGGSNLKWFIGGAAAVATIAIISMVWLRDNSSNQQVVDLPDKQTEEIKTTNSSDNNLVVSNDSNDNLSTDKSNVDHSTPKESGDELNEQHEEHFTQDQHTEESSSVDIKDENTENTNNENGKTDVTNDNNNTSDQSHNLSEIAVPTAVIMAGNIEVCPGELVSLETIDQPNVIYAWNLGDGTYSNERVISHKYTEPGKYIVSLIVTSSKDRGILSKSKDIIVEVLEAPNTNFAIEYLNDKIMPSVQVTSSEALSNYHWEFGDGTSSSEVSPIKNYKKKGYYNITLTSENLDGCTSSSIKKVTIKEDYNLLAPNSFTPNGDGINDLFIPEALKTMDVEFTMTIYSQSEGLIFETKNINQQWDGSNQQNGENCNEGTYIWVVSLTNSQGKSEQYKGAVLLLK